MGWLMTVDGDIEERFPESGNFWRLEELQLAVDGYIEIVRMPGAPEYLVVVDEEGKLKKKPVNFRASSAAGQLIVGNALVVNEQEID
jgi:hypothetical protein